ncbi:hypothetical protein BUALT_Bualt04G0161500 [Buddleja alternifolia]|uniref:Uncharacterized protein n=1 Tax=Buddleja alternifolia TaxID=168488 RepID=A0AAV6XVU7_9LAMI|nr:hypothetical protein BUALT_Bualt04G0161500 [Buddleja alternifolia]
MFAVRLLRQIRVRPVAADNFAHARIPRFGKFDYYHSWKNLNGVKSQVLSAVPESSHRTFDLRRFCQYAKKLRDSGCKSTNGKMVVYALLGSISLWPRKAYCADGFHMSSIYPRTISAGASRSEENLRCAILFIKKLLVPVFLFLNVWWNWGQSHPVFLAAKVALIFLSTKPIPSSVHLFIDQLRHQMSQQPLLYRFKPLQVKAVEVEDYIFLCLARVEIKDERLVLIGILGSWWNLPLSSSNEVFFFYKSSWMELISLVKNRFRFDADVSSS